MFELKDVKAAKLWILPPTAMEVAIKLLWEDKLAYPQWPHVFVVPCFVTYIWRRDLGKNADILFTVPAGVPFWGGSQFEPLIVAIVFPLAHVSNYTGPWAVRGGTWGGTMNSLLRRDSSAPQEGHWGRGGPILRDTASGTQQEFLAPTHLEEGTQNNYMTWTGHCQECLTIRRRGHGLFCGNFLLVRGNYPPCRSVWCGKCYRESPNDHFPRLDHLQSGSDLEVNSTYMQTRYRCGRDGDHLMGVPFECDLCSFWNVVGRDPDVTNECNEFTLTAIRCMFLDDMWA